MFILNMLSYTQFKSNELFDAIESFGFPTDLIKAIMFDYTSDQIGIGGSFFLKFLLEKKNGKKEGWQPSDVDIFVTEYSILEDFKAKFGWYEMKEIQIDYCSTYHSMNGVTDVLEIYGDRDNTLQIIVVNKPTIGEHLLDCDFDFTKIAFTKDIVVTTEKIFEAIDNRQTLFPDTFRDVRHFIKVWFRAEKYKRRGFEIIYPRKITMKNVIYSNGYDYHIPPCILKKFDKIIGGKFFMFKEHNHHLKIEIKTLKNELATEKSMNSMYQDTIEKMEIQIYDLEQQLKVAKAVESDDTAFWREKAESLQKEMKESDETMFWREQTESLEKKMKELREKETKYNGMLNDIKSLIE